MDLDGDLDLVLCNGAQIVVARYNQGIFTPEPPVPSPSNLIDLAVGDFNGDGFPDVAGVGTLVMPVGGVQTAWGRVVSSSRTAPSDDHVRDAGPPPARSPGNLERTRGSRRRRERGRHPGRRGLRCGRPLGPARPGSVRDRKRRVRNTDALSGGGRVRGHRDRGLQPGRRAGPRGGRRRRRHGRDDRQRSPRRRRRQWASDRSIHRRDDGHDPGAVGARSSRDGGRERGRFMDFVVANYNTVVVCRGGGGFAFVPTATRAGSIPVRSPSGISPATASWTSRSRAITWPTSAPAGTSRCSSRTGSGATRDTRRSR